VDWKFFKHGHINLIICLALTEMLGLHQTYVGLLAHGERSPNLDTAKAIAGAPRCIIP
jgi:hypothetical protein